MGLASPFKSEVLRPITTWVIPGSIAIGPYLLILAFYVPAFDLLGARDVAVAAVVTICVLAAGLILDNIGSSIEAGWWDPLVVKKYPDHLENWDRYLKLCIKDEIAAARYLKTHVTQIRAIHGTGADGVLDWSALARLHLQDPVRRGDSGCVRDPRRWNVYFLAAI